MNIFSIVQSFDDFEDFAESVTWDLEFIQLSPGKFRADLVLFGDMDIQVAEAIYNKALLQQGSVPHGFTFAINHPCSAPINWRHLDFPANGIIVFPENREHYGLSQSDHHPFIVTYTETFLAVVAEELGLPGLNQFVHKGKVLLCDPMAIHRIQTFLSSLCATIKNTSMESLSHLINHETKWKIARLLLYALASSTKIKPNKRLFYRRKRVVDRVLEYVNTDLSESKSISELCKIAEVDERTLRNIFYEQFSLSPNKFMKCYRLNAVRSALKGLDSTQVLITDIANEKGFWHMGQFAKDYRQMFGELPSETLGTRSAGLKTS